MAVHFCFSKRSLGIALCLASLSIWSVSPGFGQDRPREGSGRVEGNAPREGGGKAGNREGGGSREGGNSGNREGGKPGAGNREGGNREGGERGGGAPREGGDGPRTRVEVRGDQMQALGILGNAAVQKELNLEDGQLDQLRELAGQVVETQRGAVERAGNIRGEGSAGRRREITESTQRRMRELEERIPKILNEQQQQRYQELELQHGNMAALGNERVARSLKLSEDQLERLRNLWRDASRRPQGGRGENADGARRPADEFNEKAAAILTPAQREQFEKMKGEPFRPAEGGENRGEGDQPREGDNKPPEGGRKPGETGEGPRGGGDRPKTGGQQPREGVAQPAEGGDKPRGGGDRPGGEKPAGEKPPAKVAF